MDSCSKEKRSEIMSKVKRKDTRPEIQVRKYLFSRGLRYRTNFKSLPGSPDIVLKNIKQLFSFTVASGTDIRVAPVIDPVAIPTIGFLK